MAFTVGQRVVCVDDAPTSTLGKRQLTEGKIYTIRWVGIATDDDGEFDGVRLVEFSAAQRSSFIQNDFPFWAKRFRPLVERKTDISIFKAMLNPTEVNA